MKRILIIVLFLTLACSSALAGDFYEISTKRIVCPRGTMSALLYNDEGYIPIDDIYLKSYPHPKTIELKYRDVSADGKFVEEMTSEEKAVVDAELAALAIQREADSRDITKIIDLRLKAAFLVLAEESGMTAAEFKTKVDAKIIQLSQ